MASGAEDRGSRRSVAIMGAGGRDFHNYLTVFRDDETYEVVAFTAAQIPGIANRVFPASLAGPSYPAGIPILPEEQLPGLARSHRLDEIVLAYSDLAHEDVMHKASVALAAGADFRLLGPASTYLKSTKPLIAVCAVRTGCGKSQTARRLTSLLADQQLRPVVVRHPMPYGELEAMRVQRFASRADIDAASPTLEEREEYEAHVDAGVVVYAGVDYADILAQAEAEADVIVWDGGNNDFPFFEPDLLITVVDPLRPGHECAYHPGEATLRMADVVLVNKVNAAEADAVSEVITAVATANPTAVIVRAASDVTLADGPPLRDRRVLVVEDGPTLTHGGMPFGAGAVAAREAGVAELVDPRPFAVGSIASTFAEYPNLGPVLPAMGYSAAQLLELAATINATPCDVVVIGTPVDLARVISIEQATRRAVYALRELGSPMLADVTESLVARARTIKDDAGAAPERRR